MGQNSPEVWCVTILFSIDGGVNLTSAEFHNGQSVLGEGTHLSLISYNQSYSDIVSKGEVLSTRDIPQSKGPGHPPSLKESTTIQPNTPPSGLLNLTPPPPAKTPEHKLHHSNLHLVST